MFRENEEHNVIKFVISSEMALVDRVIKDSIEFVKKHSFNKSDKIKTVIRELLINAIEHGSKNQIEKEVKCDVELVDKTRIRIKVKDSGMGFDFKSIDYKIPNNPNQQRNRGLALVNAMADDLIFNDKGNMVTAYLTFVTTTDFEIIEKEDKHIIIPNGDLTASCADKCRTLLFELLDNKVQNFCIDFRIVEDIDSICLSLLITFSKMLKKKNPDAKISLINVREDLISLFKLTRMDKVYDISG
ncbi:MAG: ATP-binding protein [Melioribacteraceae bacterium]|nr:ATP-binding protein [Melioribacteraceae bacterium]